MINIELPMNFKIEIKICRLLFTNNRYEELKRQPLHNIPLKRKLES